MRPHRLHPWLGLALPAVFSFWLSSGICHAAPVVSNAVTKVRFWSLGDTTRVVIEVQEDFEYRKDRVENPSRLFFDILEARKKLGKSRVETISVKDALLKQLRIAETSPGITRVVFDLEAGVSYTSSRLTNPERLIVELKAESPVVTTQAPALARPPAVVTATSVPSMVAGATAKPEPVLIAGPSDGSLVSASQSSARLKKLPDPSKGVEQASKAALRAPKPAGGMGEDAKFSMSRALGLKVGRIVIDAGHGGHDSGTAGPGGLLEKDLVLDVARRLGVLITSRMGSHVIFTRTEDVFVPLEARTKFANQQGADLFLSIHANSSPEQDSSGVETYYLNFANSKSAMEVAARENASSERTLHDLKDLVQTIAMQDKVEESQEFATKVQQSLYSSSFGGNRRTKNRGVKRAPFVVLIGAGMPSILAEIGFISNPKDEALFRKDAYRQRIAEGLFKGLSRYASTLSQMEMASSK